MTTRSYINPITGPASELICKTVGFDKFLPCSSGVEACEAAVKIARKWGYTVKGIADN